MMINTRSDAGSWAQQGVVPRQGQGTGWVLVADEAIARILTTHDDTPGMLDALEALTDPAAHTKEGDLKTNDAGRRGVPGTAGAGLTASAGDASRHQEARSFAKRVATHLADALRQKRYATLRIAAAPRFLGLLRQELDANVKAVVVQELDKELTHASDDDVARRFFPPKLDA